jgi:hypothetical protein
MLVCLKRSMFKLCSTGEIPPLAETAASSGADPRYLSFFVSYHNRLNVFSCILDPALHTPSYTRQHSSILFTCILTTAAKALLPQTYPSLLQFANNMLGRAFAEGVVEIGLVQGLAVMAFWKEAGEAGGWRRVGYGELRTPPRSDAPL